MKDLVITTFKTASIARVEINSPKGALAFDFEINRCDTAEELGLDEKTFYEPYCRRLVFPHYEIRLAEGSVPESVLAKAKTHYIKGKDGRMYICWPYRIPGLNAVTKVMNGWAAAAFHALATEGDSNAIIAHYCGVKGATNFLAGLVEGLRRDHDIRLEYRLVR